jgi:hypothetical protein
MGRIVRLTESDLTRIVRRVLKENKSSHPQYIKVELTTKWEKFMEKESEDSRLGDTRGYSNYRGETIKMVPNMLYNIGGGKHVDEDQYTMNYFAEYKPEDSKIEIHVIDCFGKSRNDLDNVKKVSINDTLWSKEPWDWDKGMFTTKPNVQNKCAARGENMKSMFHKRFEVGETDHRGYFEIVGSGEL